MKKIVVWSILWFLFLIGAISGMLIYKQILDLFSGIAGKIAISTWFWICALFIISLVGAAWGLRNLVMDMLAAKIYNPLTILRGLKYYLSGFIGFYIGISLGGSLIFSVYLLFRAFF